MKYYQPTESIPFKKRNHFGNTISVSMSEKSKVAAFNKFAFFTLIDQTLKKRNQWYLEEYANITIWYPQKINKTKN